MKLAVYTFHPQTCIMHIQYFFLIFAVILFLPSPSSSRKFTTLTQGSSISPPDDVLISTPTGIFTAGFYPVGENAYSFSIWFTEPLEDGNFTVVWMANRDQPVNQRYTRLSLLESGNLVLTDAGQIIVWMSGTTSISFSKYLILNDDGNLALYTNERVVLWQSFNSPTDTLLPLQSLTRNSILVSSRSRTNYSSGYYKLYFDNDNVLRLLYDGEITSVFWPPPWLNSWQAGRTTYKDSKIATLGLLGNFTSSDSFRFRTTDFGFGIQRRMTLDHDGNVRVYSLDKGERIWKITWQATIQPCKTHGICGGNGICTYDPSSGPRCSCLPGYKIKNYMDWSEGCLPDFELPCNDSDSSYFLKLSHVEYYGYDIAYHQNYTLEECKNLCLSYCDCRGFQYKFEWNNGFYSCFPKRKLFNGYQSTGFQYWIYLRLPRSIIFSNENPVQEFNLQCTNPVNKMEISYKKRHEHGWLKSLLWCTGAVGLFEIICVLVFLSKTRQRLGVHSHGYLQVNIGFKKFTYRELKTASCNFSQEIGQGGSGVVYKGKLSDNQVIAIKCLNEATQGEAEFLAEVSIIGRLNHLNLIGSLGYCAEGKHRLLVYEYLEHGSLAENLDSNTLDWRKKFDIALGTAKGLAYLHEECLEWVLHCDVKPQNILLDSSYQPKVADFGLSKLLSRGSNMEQSNVSRIRGTRGYMAPEWVFHLPITSKVDVYSYGIVVLEMVTGRSPKGVNADGDKRLVSWVREIMNEGVGLLWAEKIVDPNMGGEYDVVELENLVKVALLCAQENKDDRPTMRQVVDMLLLLGKEIYAPPFLENGDRRV
ncbi:hypothetical protein RD792_012433 [Penstemon davidsonii]|uniref:Receptor-like serine/threonine-protein kinase n=1 Tax=Penstemon davidsonii TaxID=160366 RepID=A0ABR0CX85_9LAMI|nr:hypothetical protein RD792_012433 [Penstemon davidsonii]